MKNVYSDGISNTPIGNVFFDGLANVYMKPDNINIIERHGAYALIYIEDIDSFMFTIPASHINQDFYKMAGGGIEGLETPLEAVKRELIEETGYSINDNFNLICSTQYLFNFKPLKIQEEYWVQHNTYFLYTVKSIKDTDYPNDSYWVSKLENIPIKLLKKDYIKKFPHKLHFSQQMAFKHFINHLDKELILHEQPDARFS
jgi:8-oxo-dGTP pyrophosphatase MutT (NUDIX family)